MKRDDFTNWVKAKIAGEMSAKKRWGLSQQLSELTNEDPIEVFRAIEGVTKAKDKGTLLEVLDASR